MRILVLSDSHSKEIQLDFSKYDFMIHCGDYGRSNVEKFYYVRGNCDFKGPKEEIISIKGKKVYITHGDLYSVKCGYDRLMYRCLELEASYCFFGHTHCPILINEKCICINPGSYQEGYYAIITEEAIEFYKEDICYKKIINKW